MKHKIAPSYSKEFLEVDRPSPLVDNFIESLIQESVNGNIDKNISNSIFYIFKEKKPRKEWK